MIYITDIAPARLHRTTSNFYVKLLKGTSLLCQVIEGLIVYITIILLALALAQSMAWVSTIFSETSSRHP